MAVEILFFSFGVVLFFSYYVFARYSYKVEGKNLIIRRWVFSIIPFGIKKIPLTEIKELRALEGFKDYLLGGDVFGNLYLKKGGLIILKRGLIRRIYITPPKLTDFIEMINKFREV